MRVDRVKILLPVSMIGFSILCFIFNVFGNLFYNKYEKKSPVLGLKLTGEIHIASNPIPWI